MDRIVVLGRPTCEDTMVTESRLRALDVPFVSRNIEADPDAEREVEARNGGNRVTPTIVIGEGERERVVTEPALESLIPLLAAAGYASLVPPRATRYHGDVSGQALGRPDGRDGQAGATAVLVAHGGGCMACLGYARQLARQAPALAAEESRAVVIVPDAGTAAAWRGEVDAALVLGDERAANWAARARAAVGARGDEVLVLVLDRYGAARAGAAAREAGGLLDPPEAVRWARYLNLECPECTEELDWPT